MAYVPRIGVFIAEAVKIRIVQPQRSLSLGLAPGTRRWVSGCEAKVIVRLNTSDLLFMTTFQQCICVVVAGFSLAMSAVAWSQDTPGFPPRNPGLPGVAPGQSAEKLVRISATADRVPIAAGEIFYLAFIFDIEPDWHIYWKNPGESGGPTDIRVHAPGAFEIGRTLYPRPMKFEGDDGITYGYKDKVVLYVEVTAPQIVPPDTVMVNAQLNWMVCKDICLLGRTMQMISVPTVKSPLAPTDEQIDPDVHAFKSRLPQPLSALADAKAVFEDGTLTIELPAGDYTTAEFFPMEMPGVTYDRARIQRKDSTITVTVPVTVNPRNAMGKDMKIAGTVGLGDRQTDPSYDIDIPLPSEQ